MEKKVAKVFLMNKENKLLLQLRDNIPTIAFPDYWACFGGGVEEGETIEQAAIREVKEEIGDFEIQNMKPIGKFFVPSENAWVFSFKADINLDEDQIDQIKLTEGQAAKYFTEDELEEIRVAPPLKEFIDENKDKIF